MGKQLTKVIAYALFRFDQRNRNDVKLTCDQEYKDSQRISQALLKSAALNFLFYID